jgi:GTP-binding protein
VIVAVNKADNPKRELEAAEFHTFGWDETYAISASHGRGTGDLLDAVVWALPPESEGGARAQGARGRGRGLGDRDGRRAPRALHRR